MGLSSPSKPFRLISPSKARQLQRALRNAKLTMICGLLTILVLRGALGAGKFGTPAKDFEELKHQFARVQSLHLRKQASRVLAEIVEERHRPQEAQYVVSYGVAEIVNVQSNGGVHSSDVHDKHAVHNYEDLKVKHASDLTKPDHGLDPKLSDHGAQRQDRLGENPNTVGGKPPIMLVTGYHPAACENPSGDHYLLKFIKNKVEYCNLHGIKILYSSAILDAERYGFSAQFRLLRELMVAHPEVEWFWWLASDAMFSDMAFELPMAEYKDYNMVLHGWGGMINQQQKAGWVGLTAGSFLIRNSQWSLTFLDEAGKLLDESAAGADDWPAIMQLIVDGKKIEEPVVPSEGSIHLHGYWKEPANLSEERAVGKKQDDAVPESRPFVMRFPGCKVCRKGFGVDDQSVNQCMKQMEKAFDASDGRILELGGPRITASSFSALRRLRGQKQGHKSSSAVPHTGAVPSLPHRSATSKTPKTPVTST